MEQSTWAALHAGDVVLGQDAQTWGVVEVLKMNIDRPGHVSVTLYRLGRSVVGYPPADGAVTVVSRADTRAEEAAWSVFSDAGLQPEIISETWER